MTVVAVITPLVSSFWTILYSPHDLGNLFFFCYFFFNTMSGIVVFLSIVMSNVHYGW